MKEKPQSPESILARAEEFFSRENYLVALREFEKAACVLQRDDIRDKINICKKEMRRLRLKDLIKRGERHLGKKNIRKALRCFEEAYAIGGEDRLKERIDQLKENLAQRDSFQDARDAEAAGHFERAADLYGKALAGRAREDIIVKQACCFIRAGKHSEAASALRRIPSTSPRREQWQAEMLPDQGLQYDYGFALAGAGRYYECLKVWDSIESRDSGFIKQKESVRNFLEADLHRRFDSGGDCKRILEEGKYLRDSAGRDSIGDLVEYCKYALIDRLWEEERYEDIRELLLPYPERMDAHLLALYAKVFYKLAELSAEYLTGLRMYWLSAIYDPEIAAQFSSGNELRNEVRKVLAGEAEELIKKYNNTGNILAKKVLACWNVEKKLIEDLYALVGKRKELSHLIRTPVFAEACGLTSGILSLIKNNRDFFSDERRYLSAGSYYSAAASSLFYIETGEYEKALPGLPGAIDSEFTGYGVERVKFAYGMHCLDTGKETPERYFRSSAILFEKEPAYEQELIDQAVQCHELDALQRYEKVLSDIHSGRPTKGIADTLSLVMTRRSVLMYNADQISLKVLATTARKALELNPENELAGGTLDNLQLDLEIEELFKAMNNHKMGKACRLAAESEHREVRESFFEFINDIFQDLDAMMLDRREKLLLLNKLAGWCSRVDASHPLLNRINMKQRRL